MSFEAWWIVWCGLFVVSFFVLEFRALAAKARGDRDGRTLTDMVKAWTKSTAAKVGLVLFLLWLCLHFLGVPGL